MEMSRKLNKLGKNTKVTLLWVPGRRNIKGNKKANILVKKRPGYLLQDQNPSVAWQIAQN